MKIREDIGLTFDDVLLVPRKSAIDSRFNGEIDFTMQFLPNVSLRYPLISANMDSVTELQMMQAMHKLHGLGIIHRFMPIEKHKSMLNASGVGPTIGCVGIGDNGKKRAEALVAVCDGFLVDIAHGHCDAMIRQIEWLKSLEKPVIAGNIATASGAIDLMDAGAHSIKVGVGPGSLCSTRLKTGAGIPQLTAIMDVREAIDAWYRYKDQDFFKPTLIADGGIKNSGDIIKAFVAGADAVMMGNVFAGTEESPGQIINMPGKGKIKVYRGMASKEAQEDWKGKATSIEGEMTWVPYKGSVDNIFEDIINGMCSGMSYQNARNVNELRENAVFVRQTPAGYVEAQPHALKG